MLAAARGVSLGLGRINLSDLHTLPKERVEVGKVRRLPKAAEKTKIVIKKHIDKKKLCPRKTTKSSICDRPQLIEDLTAVRHSNCSSARTCYGNA
ncbi:hypothetical protein Tcan_06269 [Toxocara canis]|uniref:Uncharacterized protein n=1 Tax=Toxocara canis TaxID=6265 RepID=A0A0B2UL62_TOXCA|nr:hypothetical protein Tcan_06269 [Toxocara canis]